MLQTIEQQTCLAHGVAVYQGGMLMVFLVHLVVFVDTKAIGERQKYALDGWHSGCLALEGIFDLCLLIIVVWSLWGTNIRCFVGWLFVKQNQQNGAWLIDIAVNGCDNNCITWWSSCVSSSLLLDGIERVTCCCEDFIDDDETGLIVLSLLPPRTLLLHQLSMLKPW